MPAIKVHISDNLLRDLDNNANAIHLPRAKYIRHAIEYMNNKVKNQQTTECLKKISLRVRKESMRVNKEFNRIEHDPNCKN